MLPYSRNPFFLGREEVLVRLRRHLQAGQTMAFPQPQAICGLGGLGKTQGDHLITSFTPLGSPTWQTPLPSCVAIAYTPS